MKFSLAFAVVIALFGVANAQPRRESSPCNRGPAYWCRNDETANECGVHAFCNLLKDDQKIKFNQPAKIETAPPVNVSFYYESLCPGCKQVWATELYPTYQKLAGSGIVNFEFIPYGNAREQSYGSSWIFTCQHGPAECVGKNNSYFTF